MKKSRIISEHKEQYAAIWRILAIIRNVGRSRKAHSTPNHLSILLGCPAGSDRFTIVIVSWAGLVITYVSGTYPTPTFIGVK